MTTAFFTTPAALNNGNPVREKAREFVLEALKSYPKGLTAGHLKGILDERDWGYSQEVDRVLPQLVDQGKVEKREKYPNILYFLRDPS